MTAARAIRTTRAGRGSITRVALVLLIPLLVHGFAHFARSRSPGFTEPIAGDMGNLVASPASAHRTVLAMARARTHEHAVHQGLFLADPIAQIQVSGTDFAIEGSDRNHSDHEPALVTTGVVNSIRGPRSASQWVNLRGDVTCRASHKRLAQDELVQKLIETYHSPASAVGHGNRALRRRSRDRCARQDERIDETAIRLRGGRHGNEARGPRLDRGHHARIVR